MTRHLSISQAWDETKARIAADGRLLLTVALAFIAIPTAIAKFAFPGEGPTNLPRSAEEVVVMLIVTLIGLVGQLALVRLAIGPSVSVGESITHAVRRTPSYVGAALLLLFALFLIAIPVGMVLTAMGMSFAPGAAPAPNGGALFVLLLFLIVMLVLGVRMLVTSPVASAEGPGPIGIIRRSWRLTAGHTWRLLGFICLFLLGAGILVAVVDIVVGIIVTAALGRPDPGSVSALVAGLVMALLSAAVTTLFIVMIARIYVQLADDSAAEASVPTSGT